MACANSKPLIFTRTTEPTHNQRSISAPFSPCGRRAEDEGGKYQYTGSIMFHYFSLNIHIQDNKGFI